MHDDDWENDARDLAEMLLAGDAMLGFVHELNNTLNSMMLQASVVELKAGEGIRQEVAVIRKLGAQAANRLALFARFRERYREMKAPVDLNDSVRAVLANKSPMLGRAPNLVQPELFTEPLMILAHAVALKQLILVLLRIAASWHPGGTLWLRTTRTDEQVWLIIQVLSGESSEVAGDPWTDFTVENENSLDLLAVESRARLVDAKLQMAANDAGTRALAAIWAVEHTAP
jgi:signal transduction histidine kinase